MTTATKFPTNQSDGDLATTPENAGTLGDKAKYLTDAAVEKVKDATGAVVDTGKDAATSVGQQVNRATNAVGSGMESMAQRLREKMPHKGAVGAATASVADRLESGGKYLEAEGIKGIADDVTNLIRRNPFPALLVGVAFGYFIGRITARS